MTLDRFLEDLERVRAHLGAKARDIDVLIEVDPTDIYVDEDGEWAGDFVMDVQEVEGRGLQIVIGAA
ncbi:MAG TPA: hypothetical protein VHT75_04150 [Acidimicrobiales bacterium]|jgi:hypothetical protein|nr:hypothetical protein [Acidimicrobiales bacterium]